MIGRLIQPNILLSAHYLDYNNDNNSISHLTLLKPRRTNHQIQTNHQWLRNPALKSLHFIGPFGMTSQLILRLLDSEINSKTLENSQQRHLSAISNNISNVALPYLYPTPLYMGKNATEKIMRNNKIQFKFVVHGENS